MSRPQQQSGPGIGQTLKDARRRIGMDVKEAEERTKIRARYLRALEAEDWEVLPAPAYVRGFLRTYGQVLGIDGAALADEFRRTHEEEAAVSAAPEPLRERRRSSGGRAPGTRPPSRGPLIAAVAAGIVVLLVALALLGGGGDDEPDTRPGKEAGKIVGGSGGDGDKGGKQPALTPIEVTVEPLDTVELCLVGDGDEALIPTQVLGAGSSERFDGNESYRLDLDGGGVVRLTAGSEREKLKASGNASFEADSRGIREIDYAGPDCP